MSHWASTPLGAGLCVQRDVANRYAAAVTRDPIRKTLDRQGASLVSGGDIDLVYTGLSMGYGMGVFRELSLRHLIPPRRLTAEYLSSLSEGIGFSSAILDVLWNRGCNADPIAPSMAALLRNGLAELSRRVTRRRYIAARRLGRSKGQRFLQSLGETDLAPAGSADCLEFRRRGA